MNIWCETVVFETIQAFWIAPSIQSRIALTLVVPLLHLHSPFTCLWKTFKVIPAIPWLKFKIWQEVTHLTFICNHTKQKLFACNTGILVFGKITSWNKKHMKEQRERTTWNIFTCETGHQWRVLLITFTSVHCQTLTHFYLSYERRINFISCSYFYKKKKKKRKKIWYCAGYYICWNCSLMFLLPWHRNMTHSLGQHPEWKNMKEFVSLSDHTSETS